MKIHLLLDENTSEYFLTEMLRAAGHDVRWLQELAPYGTDDENVLAIATKEKRILYTRDRDFLDLTRKVTKHSGVILEYRNKRSNNLMQLQIVTALAIVEKQFSSLKNQIIILNSYRS